MFFYIEPALDAFVMENMVAMKFNTVGSVLKLVSANGTAKINWNLLKRLIGVGIMVFFDGKWFHFFEIESFWDFPDLLSEFEEFLISHVVNVDFIFIIFFIVFAPTFTHHLVPESFEVLSELSEDFRRGKGWVWLVGLMGWNGWRRIWFLTFLYFFEDVLLGLDEDLFFLLGSVLGGFYFGLKFLDLFIMRSRFLGLIKRFTWA